MTIKQNQHYLARAYLRGFVDPREEQRGQNVLWVYERDHPVRRKSVRKAAVRELFYSIPLDEAPVPEAQDPNWIEDTLQSLESTAARTLRKLTRGVFPLPPTEKSEFAGFIALSLCRTPLFREIVDTATVRQWMEHVRELAENPEGLEQRIAEVRQVGGPSLTPEMVQTVYHALREGAIALTVENRSWSLRGMFEAANPLMDLFNSLRWVFLRAPRGEYFIVGDSPVVVMDPVAKERGPKDFHWTTGVKFFFPVNRSFLLMGEVHPEGDVRGLIHSRSLSELNYLQVLRAHLQVFAPYRSGDLRALVDKVHTERLPLMSLPEWTAQRGV